MKKDGGGNAVTLSFLSDLCGREAKLSLKLLTLDFLSDLCGRED